MFIVAAAPLGISAPTLIVGAAGIAYVVSLARDWRPVKALRQENLDLRGMLEQAQDKIAALEAQVAVLEKATDLTGLLEEHKKIADVLDRVVSKLNSLDGAVHANTAALEAIARGSALKETLDGMKEKTP